MVDSGVNPEAHEEVRKSPRRLGGKLPEPEDMYNVPTVLLSCILEIAPRIKKSGAWWSLGGDLAENLLSVYVRPVEVEILTDSAGLEKIANALSGYGLSPIQVREKRLEREADLDFKKYPVLVRSSNTDFTMNGTRVTVQADYQMKVGDWEWGDPLFFDPSYVNIGGVRIPLMPTSLKSELYITLGWRDRAKLISEAFTRAHSPTYEGAPESEG
ncbi:MAG: hypothetical protein OK456_11185 [Thaumarchaeota archaeon]|nr:hypothetical protein [Nitrososphaerota archaeon]